MVFGDSLSDVQGADALVSSLLNTDQIQIGAYPAPPYYEGRWSNGVVWAGGKTACASKSLHKLSRPH